MEINPIKIGAINTGAIKAEKAENSSKGLLDSFSGILENTIDQVNDLETNANRAIEKFVAGDIDIHDVMIETEKASTALQLTVQLRNKALEAYQEIMRMQI